jgi:diphthine methyl ester acylhydrolase
MTSVRYDTIWPADSVEFCPIEGYRDYFCCATYKLFEPVPNDNMVTTAEEAPAVQRRSGTCRLYQVQQEISLTW